MTPELHTAIRQALIRSQALGSNQDVRALFVDPRLQPWRNNVPEGGSPAARAAMLIAYLHDRANTQGQKALALLLQVLGELEPEALGQELLTLAGQLDPSLAEPERAGYKPAPTEAPSVGAGLQPAQGPAPTQSTPAAGPPPQAAEHYTLFDLHIGPGGHTVATSTQGQATAEIDTNVPAAIATAIPQVEQRTTNEATLRELGEALFRWLFPAPIEAHLLSTEAIARDRGHKLHIRLRVEPPRIAALPLEFLYWRQRGHFLAVNPRTALSRHINVNLPGGRVRRHDGPLHMLAIIADAADLPRLDPDEWEDILLGALDRPLSANQLTLQTVKKATRRDITAALTRRKPDIVQFIGHGVYQESQAHVALVNAFDGNSWLLNDEQFTSLFAGYDDNLGLVSLATCESGQTTDPQGFSGLAPRLVQRGIPAVLAMQYKVYVKTARVVLDEFYTALADRKPLDWAIQQARNAVALDFGQDNREFATPVLYQRADNGDVFGDG